MAFSDISKRDKSFKTLINKEFSTPSKAFYEEFGANTINMSTQEVWAQSIDSDPATAVAAGVAKEFTLFELSPVAGYTTSIFYVVSGSGFTPGTTIDRAAVNPDLLQRNFISDKYGADYSVQLYDNNDNQIFTTDAIDWFFDYQTGILYIQDPGSFPLPYKISAYQYIGNTADNVIQESGIFKQTGSFYATTNNVQVTGSFAVDGVITGSGAGLTDIPASSINGLQLFQITSGSVTASVDTDDIEKIFSVTSESIDLIRVNADGDLTVRRNLIAENYIISSSVTYMTQSFSSGSTIFGDTTDDTHQFTGSLFITGSTFESIPQAGNDTLVAYLDSGSGELKFSNIIDGGSF